MEIDPDEMCAVACEWRIPVVFAGEYSIANTLAGVVFWQQWHREIRSE